MNDIREFVHENTGNGERRWSEAEAIKSHLSRNTNQDMVAKLCVDCGGEFKIPPGIPFFSCYKRCEPCALTNDRKMEAERQEREQAKRTAEREAAFNAICPPLYQDFDPFKLPAKSRPMIDRVVAWKPNPKGMLLIGASGAGKTRIAYQLMKQLIMAGVTVRAFDCISFGHECQKAFMNGRGEEWAEEIAKAPVVYFDDLFKIKMTERVECELFGIIERRAAYLRPTIATLNSTGEMIEGMMSEDRGKPMVRRLREFNEAITFNL